MIPHKNNEAGQGSNSNSGAGKATFTLNDKQFQFVVRSERHSAALRCAVDDSYQLIPLLMSIEPGSTFWDMGAGFGFTSIVAATFARAGVFYFEPNSENADLLDVNTSLNSLQQRIKPFPFFEMDRSRSVHSPHKDKGSGPRRFRAAEGQAVGSSETRIPLEANIESSCLEAAIRHGKVRPPRYLRIGPNVHLRNFFDLNSLVLSHRELEMVILDGVKLPFSVAELKKVMGAHGFSEMQSHLSDSGDELVFAWFSQETRAASERAGSVVYDAMVGSAADHLKRSFSYATTTGPFPGVLYVDGVIPSNVLDRVRTEVAIKGNRRGSRTSTSDQKGVPFDEHSGQYRSRWMSAFTSVLFSEAIISANRKQVQRALDRVSLDEDLVLKYTAHLEVVRSSAEISRFLLKGNDTFLAFFLWLQSPERAKIAVAEEGGKKGQDENNDTFHIAPNMGCSLIFPKVQSAFIEGIQQSFLEGDVAIFFRYDLCRGRAVIVV